MRLTEHSRWTLKAVLGCAAFLVASCQSQEVTTDPSATTPSPEPYWVASPNLPAQPQGFCKSAGVIMEADFKASHVRCKASPGTGYGIRGQRDGSEIVVLLGANDEWFAFAYHIEGQKLQVRLRAKELDALVEQLEQVFPAQG